MDNTNLDRLTKRISLLAAAEESFCMAASVLKPAIQQAIKASETSAFENPPDERLETGLHLLEEAMGAHGRYAASLK